MCAFSSALRMGEGGVESRRRELADGISGDILFKLRKLFKLWVHPTPSPPPPPPIPPFHLVKLVGEEGAVIFILRQICGSEIEPNWLNLRITYLIYIRVR